MYCRGSFAILRSSILEKQSSSSLFISFSLRFLSYLGLSRIFKSVEKPLSSHRKSSFNANDSKWQADAVGSGAEYSSNRCTPALRVSAIDLQLPSFVYTSDSLFFDDMCLFDDRYLDAVELGNNFLRVKRGELLNLWLDVNAVISLPPNVFILHGVLFGDINPRANNKTDSIMNIANCMSIADDQRHSLYR
mmetsp:Transcript_14150/g.21232  ORF Transcript_14150/g.21232 Transcript_14150/m.21232 type:complete len:191 (+) Transcript_14150:740-1312(+)